MSEGFQSARPLSVKFVTLYQLASELLSPQPHYDWGLRAVKSVLRVAGRLKRGDPGINEEGILMRALRDFNTPKMPTADLPIFSRLIRDLFPSFFQLPTKLRADLVKLATQACKEARPALQHDHGFIAKVVQLQDLMDVRHSVMLVGPAGAGKTTVWKTLAAAHNLNRPKNKALCVFEVVDPKALTSNELYGYMTMAKEWRQGVLSIIMRGMSKNYKELGYSASQTHKWVILDGDIDAVWIESMVRSGGEAAGTPPPPPPPPLLLLLLLCRPPPTLTHALRAPAPPPTEHRNGRQQGADARLQRAHSAVARHAHGV